MLRNSDILRNLISDIDNSESKIIPYIRDISSKESLYIELIDFYISYYIHDCNNISEYKLNLLQNKSKNMLLQDWDYIDSIESNNSAYIAYKFIIHYLEYLGLNTALLHIPYTFSSIENFCYNNLIHKCLIFYANLMVNTYPLIANILESNIDAYIFDLKDKTIIHPLHESFKHVHGLLSNLNKLYTFNSNRYNLKEISANNLENNKIKNFILSKYNKYFVDEYVYQYFIDIYFDIIRNIEINIHSIYKSFLKYNKNGSINEYDLKLLFILKENAKPKLYDIVNAILNIEKIIIFLQNYEMEYKSYADEATNAMLNIKKMQYITANKNIIMETCNIDSINIENHKIIADNEKFNILQSQNIKDFYNTSDIKNLIATIKMQIAILKPTTN